MDPPTFTSLIPASGPVDARELVAGLTLDPPALDPPDGSARPYTIVNFISSVDGRAAFRGQSRAFSDPGDRALFHALRSRVDAVLAGTGTLREEGYGRIIPSAERRAERVAAGRTPEPLAVIISASGRIPTEIPMFAESEQQIVLFTPTTPDLGQVRADVRVHELDAAGDAFLDAALGLLRTTHGVQTLLCEGGPTLFAALLRAGLVDELFLTLSPTLAGGDSGTAITTGAPLDALAALQLRGVLNQANTLYLRYATTR